MTVFLLSALGFFLLQFRSYRWGSRAAALKALEPSSRLRAVLERYWLLSNLAMATGFAGLWAGLHFYGIDDRGAAMLCWLVSGLGGAGWAILSGLPDYIVIDAQNRRREKRRNRGR